MSIKPLGDKIVVERLEAANIDRVVVFHLSLSVIM